MKRRTFTRQTALAPLALVTTTLAGPAWAQAPASATPAPVEGTHFIRLTQPLPASGGRIDVVEFFWYGCPHCNSFEPLLDAWAKRQPADVAVRRMPVAFRENPFTAHQKIYFALEAMGKVDEVHRKVFAAIHVERQKLDQLPEIVAFMTKNGLDGKAFSEAYNSFGVQSKVKQARQLADGYKVDGVPALGIGGRFFTSTSLAGSPDRALAVSDFLIQRVRRGA
jgi:protein dithiol oxidoreductase (disulfide-forming)